jgi:beta-barrel assembly-enhancing protease
MKSYIAQYSETNGAPISDATVLLLPKHISIGYNNYNDLHTLKTWLYKNITTQYDAAINKTIINHQLDGQSIAIYNNIIKDVEERIAYSNKNWLAKKIAEDGTKIFTILGIMVALLVIAYIYLIPYLSERLAKKIPVSYEITLGNKMYNAFVDTSKKDTELTQLLNTYYNAMEIKTAYPIKITVIKDPTVNAYAIMGGNIVVYTGLLQKIKRHEELAALLSHEFTHVNNKHTTRMVFRELGSGIFLSLLLGNMNDVSATVISNATQLNRISYSRSIEKEADLEGLKLLQQRKINNNGFVALFDDLMPSSKDATVTELLSSHPDIDKRIAYIKNDPQFNAGDSTTLQNQLLHTIFKLIRGDSDF